MLEQQQLPQGIRPQQTLDTHCGYATHSKSAWAWRWRCCEQPREAAFRSVQAWCGGVAAACCYGFSEELMLMECWTFTSSCTAGQLPAARRPIDACELACGVVYSETGPHAFCTAEEQEGVRLFGGGTGQRWERAALRIGHALGLVTYSIQLEGPCIR